MSSSYDQPEEFVSMEQFYETMQLVRLQISLPVAVLGALGATLTCALLPKYPLGAVSYAHPTLLTPNNYLVGLYLLILFGLEIGLCVLAVTARADETKDTLVHGIGLRGVLANWLLAAWVVCFTMEWFLAAEIIALVNLLNTFTIQLSLLRFPPALSSPLDFLVIHAPVTLMFALLLELTCLHTGLIALHLGVSDARSLWPAVAGLLGVHLTVAVWECFTLNMPLASASEYLLIALLLYPKQRPIRAPEEPERERPKALLAAIIIGLVAHPLALLIGAVWGRARREQGRIRLQEEVESAERIAHNAEVEAERARVRLEHNTNN